jgi:hypothetical protein
LKGIAAMTAMLVTTCCFLQFQMVLAFQYPTGVALGCTGSICTSVSTGELSSIFPDVAVTYLNQMNNSTTILTFGQVEVANTNEVVTYTTSTITLEPGGDGTAFLVLYGLPDGLYNVTFYAMTTSGHPLTPVYYALDHLPCCVIV